MRPSNYLRTSGVPQPAQPDHSVEPPPRTTFGDPARASYQGPHKHHHDYDPSFHGPIHRRACTDSWCLVVLCIFVAWWVYVAIWAWTHADINRIIRPTDFRGQICGIGAYQNRPYLQLFDLTQCTQPYSAIAGCPTPSKCVATCTTQFWISLAVLDYTNAAWRDSLVCLDEIDAITPTFERLDVFTFIAQQKCALYTLPTAPILNGVCLPNVQTFNVTAFVDLLQATTDHVNAQAQSATALAGLQSFLPTQNLVQINFSQLRYAADVIVKSLGWIDSAMTAIELAWPYIVVITVITMLVTFGWIVIMRHWSSLLVWSSLAVIILIFGAGSGYSWWRFLQQRQQDTGQNFIAQVRSANSSDQALQDAKNLFALQNLATSLHVPNITLGTVTDAVTDPQVEVEQSVVHSAMFWLAFAIVFTVLAVIALALLCFLRSRVRIAIALVDEACKATSKMMFVLTFPLVPFIGLTLVVAFFLFVLVLLQATKTPHYSVFWTTNNTNFELANGTNCDFQNFSQQYKNSPAVQQHQVRCQFIGYDLPSEMPLYQLTNVFGLFWLTMFCVGFGQLVIAGSYAGYYWTWDKKHGLVSYPVMGAVVRAIVFHLGSIAFGSFIIALVKLIRYIIHRVQEHLEAHKDYKLVLCLLKCVQCCMWCLEKFLKFITRNAYIMIALYGKNFIWSCKESFWLLFRNMIRAAVLNRIVSFLLLLSKLAIVGGIVALSWAVYDRKIPYIANSMPILTMWWVPIVVNGLIACVIVQIFFDVFGMGVDTMFLCFLEDLERNNGSREKPYYMSKRLMKILSKKNEADERVEHIRTNTNVDVDGVV